MTKMKFQIGQKIWLEPRSMFFSSEKRNIVECEIVEVNSSSAYAVYLEDMGEYLSNPKEKKFLRVRINLKTQKVENFLSGSYYILWRTKEDFEKDVNLKERIGVAREEVHKLVDGLPLNKLEELLKIFS